jgi:hypothetical protein
MPNADQSDTTMNSIEIKGQGGYLQTNMSIGDDCSLKR